MPRGRQTRPPTKFTFHRTLSVRNPPAGSQAPQIWQSPVIADGASCGPGRRAVTRSQNRPPKGSFKPGAARTPWSGNTHQIVPRAHPIKQIQRRLYRPADRVQVVRAEAEYLIDRRTARSSGFHPVQPRQRDGRQHIGLHPNRTARRGIRALRQKVMPWFGRRRCRTADGNNGHKLAASAPGRYHDDGPDLYHLGRFEPGGVVTNHNIARMRMESQGHRDDRSTGEGRKAP